MNLKTLKVNYNVDEYVEENIQIPLIPENGLVLLVGSSGSGKSTILRNWFPHSQSVLFDNSISVIENFSSIDAGEELLRAFGLRSVPTWFRPFKTLSNGESHRAYCALCLDKGLEFIDEFTSVVDRNTAKSLSVSMNKWFHKSKRQRIILASCHKDIEEWLCPTKVYNTDSCKYEKVRYLRRPKINLEIRAGSYKDWILFKKHHYLDGNISKSCHFYVAYIENNPIGFLGVIHGTNRDIRTYWRESRLVVLPEFQVKHSGLPQKYAVYF